MIIHALVTRYGMTYTCTVIAGRSGSHSLNNKTEIFDLPAGPKSLLSQAHHSRVSALLYLATRAWRSSWQVRMTVEYKSPTGAQEASCLAFVSQSHPWLMARLHKPLSITVSAR